MRATDWHDGQNVHGVYAGLFTHCGSGTKPEIAISTQRTKPSDFPMTRAVSVTARPGTIYLNGCETWIGNAVSHAARCGSLTLLVTDKSTIARASILIALYAIPMLASCDQAWAS